MRLDDEESAMLAGELGAVRRWAISHQIAVGEFFDAADLVPVSQAHIMADTESLGEAGVRFLESLAAAPESERRVRVPTITDPRGIDFAVYRRLGQTAGMAALEARAIEALRALGVLMTDTCINYQTIMAPVRGEHLAYGDTGVAIYSNSVLGARSNFEGGPSALAAALTGRTPRYGYHLDACRRATRSSGSRRRRAISANGARWVGRRRGMRLLLGGPGRRRHRGSARFRCAEAFRHGPGELRLGGAVSHARHYRRRKPSLPRLPAASPIGRGEIEAFLAAL